LADFEAILDLNEDAVAVLSPLDTQRLHTLSAEAAVFWVVSSHGRVAAFLLAFREGARYDSTNYRWFDRRYDRFLYVDRIVVSKNARGKGLGRMLYDRLIDYARTKGVERMVCEYDVEPLNEPSRRFHDSFGFEEVGQQSFGAKRVSMQSLELDAASNPTRTAPTHQPIQP
jgi:uncharacterized protein